MAKWTPARTISGSQMGSLRELREICASSTSPLPDLSYAQRRQSALGLWCSPASRSTHLFQRCPVPALVRRKGPAIEQPAERDCQWQVTAVTSQVAMSFQASRAHVAQLTSRKPSRASSSRPHRQARPDYSRTWNLPALHRVGSHHHQEIRAPLSVVVAATTGWCVPRFPQACPCGRRCSQKDSELFLAAAADDSLLCGMIIAAMPLRAVAAPSRPWCSPCSSPGFRNALLRAEMERYRPRDLVTTASGAAEVGHNRASRV
jgi:hypothetical protein